MGTFIPTLPVGKEIHKYCNVTLNRFNLANGQKCKCGTLIIVDISRINQKFILYD